MAVTTEQVAELYVSFFNRAPDTDGLAYWVETGLAIEEISASFFDQDETTERYPDTMTDSVFVNTIYNNVFNRDADANGLVYWEQELANDNISRANMILAVTNGAQGTDQTILDNKTEVGLYSADKGINDVADATDVMRDVDETDQSVELAKKLADSHAVLDLTVNPDTLVGDAGDNTFNGLLSAAGATYSVGDNLDGGEGDDTFKLQITSDTATDASATISNTETIDITGTATELTLNTYNWSGVKTYAVNANTLVKNDFNNIKEAIDGVSFSSVKGTTAVTLNFVDDTIVDTDNDKLDIVLEKSTNKLTIATQANGSAENIYEELAIHSIGNSTDKAEIDFTDAKDIVTVVIDGDSDIKLNGTSTAMTKSELIDASALEKGLTYSSKSTVSETILGGMGNDVIVGAATTATAASAIIKGGKGDDAITNSVGGGDIWGGEGLDKITAAGGIDNIKYDKIAETGLTTATADTIASFTSATDTISFRAGDAGSAANFINNTTTGISTVELAVAKANEIKFNGKEYIYFSENGAHKILVADLDGDGVADGAIDMLTTTTFVATDIVAY